MKTKHTSEKKNPVISPVKLKCVAKKQKHESVGNTAGQ